MLKYSTKAKRLYSRFFRYRNDIDIYTEDEEKDREFYERLFSRLLDGTGIKINDITPLGCKQNVIDRCRQDPENERKKIFIVDGDIDLIFDNNESRIENLFVLNAYCIENFIVDEKSATEILYINIATDSKKNVKKKLNFEKWLKYNSEALIDLFLHFSIKKEIGQSFFLCSANQFTKKHKKETILDIEAIEKYKKTIKDEIIEELTEEKYNNILEKRRKKWEISNETLMTIVSGKDYILPLLQFRIQKFKPLKGLFSQEAIKLMLAEHCNLDRLEPLRKAIINNA